MPLQSAHVFCSHIGHTGKTTLTFQMSCYYAKRHPDLSVLVIDFAEEGDLTKRLLGGVDQSKEKCSDICGTIFDLLEDGDKKSSGIMNWIWKRDIDVIAYAIRCADHNEAIPPNLFLISSGAWPRDEEPMSDADRRRLCEKIRESLERSATNWKLFCDTDGDRRPAPFTLIAYGLCSQAVVPMHLNKADLDRIETMLYMLNDLRKAGEINTKVVMIVWNLMKSVKDEPVEHRGQTMPFSPSKVSLDILDSCNQRLATIAKELKDLFVHNTDDQELFIQSSTSCLRQLADSVLKASEELGMPFIHMADNLGHKKSLKFKSGSVEYEAKDSVIQGVEVALTTLQKKFEWSMAGAAC